jgi:hypothetical protein
MMTYLSSALISCIGGLFCKIDQYKWPFAGSEKEIIRYSNKTLFVVEPETINKKTNN